MAWTSTKIDPDQWNIRCKVRDRRNRECGAIFSAGDMIRAYPAEQHDAPPGMYYVKCPACGTEDYLTDPELLPISRHIQSVRKGIRQ